jgi:cold shock CspA family protein
LDFSDFPTRDLFGFGSQHVGSLTPTSPAPRLITNNSNNVNNNNNNNNNFPIGTFSIDSLPSSVNSSIFGNGGSKMFGSSGSSAMDNGLNFNSSAQSLMNGLSVGSGNMMNSHNNNNFNHANGVSSSDQNQGTRETGIIEKLLHSYGFIQCCERQARLFFHFSQFGGNIEHLKIGDPVEFEMTYDKRTGKPIASQVSKIAPEVVHREERVTGTVTTEIRALNDPVNPAAADTTGRISYENRGECFFLPYTKDDVEGNVQLKAGDKVSFQIATNNRGNLGACHIRLENSIHPVKYRGVVCSMKESFGFIERADVVKEIFFHFSEAEGTNLEIRPGEDVEFTIQTRNGKEVACNITRLPPGSVIFEDVDSTIMKGQVLKPLEINNPLQQQQQPAPPSDPLPGRIKYRNAADHSEVEVPYGDKDQKGDFTLRHGDWVQFMLATDRRDQLQRATCISLLDDTFQLSGEKREQGVVAQLKDGFGFIRCVERSARLFFHFTEVLETSREICVGDEIEFTCVQDPTSSFSNPRLSAIRIKHLPEGTVKFETLIESAVEGVVTREAPKSPVKSQERTEGGVITYGIGNNKKTIMYFLKDCDKSPRVGDNVKFNICQVSGCKT